MPVLMSDFRTISRPVEAMHWDGKIASAAPIIEWIESKGVRAQIIKRGDPLDAWENAGRNYIRINRWVWASKDHCEIVFDPTLFGQDKFGAYKTKEFNERYERAHESEAPTGG